MVKAGANARISAFDNPRATQLPTSRTVFWCQWSLRWIAASVASTDKLPDVRRLSRFVPFGHRIAALIDFALEALGVFPRGGDRPIRPSTDSEAAFPRLDPIGQDEGARAAAGDAHAEADHLLVIYDDVLLLRLKPFHAAFGEMRLHAFDPFRSTQPRSFPVSKMLSPGLPMNGGNG